ncbi:MAG: hypothetical protein ACI35Q_08745 [Marinilabiliaceae bacterium]
MLRRDYFLKLIQDLFAAIGELLRDDIGQDEKCRRIESLYTQFGDTAQFFRSATTADAVATIARTAADAQGVKPDDLTADEMRQRIDSLASLMYADFKCARLSDGMRRDVAERALALALMVDETTDTFSFERLDRIDDLKKFLSQGDISHI